MITRRDLIKHGALGVGLLESFGSFWASAFKEVIVFASILPILNFPRWLPLVGD